jgi:hypothetical protein
MSHSRTQDRAYVVKLLQERDELRREVAKLRARVRELETVASVFDLPMGGARQFLEADALEVANGR